MESRDFRAWAREALRGHWLAAVGVGLVSMILGGGLDLTSGIDTGVTVNLDGTVEQSSVGLLDFIPREMWAMLVTVTVVSTLLALVVGGAVQLGVSTFHVKLLQRKDARFADVFSQFHRLWQGFCMQFVMGLFIFLWSLLFVIPGIIASYRYAMVPYLMAEFPDLGVMAAMRESKRLMRGNKFRLFCLHFSFIGWNFLAAMTAGIGYLWVVPYQFASEAAFYMEVTGRSGTRYQTDGPVLPEF